MCVVQVVMDEQVSYFSEGKDTELNVTQVEQWLKDAAVQSDDEARVISVPPVLPKGGEVYLFKPQSIEHKNDWKCDQYRWFQNGSKRIPKSGPVVQKIYYVCVTPNGNNATFKRLAYSLLDDTNNFTLIHYLGDHNVAVPFPHGNSKQLNSYNRTCPSVLKKEAKVNESPGNVYKEMVSRPNCSNLHQPVLVPRNVKQIRNTQAKQRQLHRLTHDALFNLHEVALDLENYVSKIITVPDLVVVCGLKELSQELDRLISLSHCPKPVLLSYDTTFQLGDFYVSSFLFRHALFQASPVIPAAFVIHERKFESVHNEMMSHMRSLLPSLQKPHSPIPMVVDNETGFNNAIHANLPGVVVLKCWNHIINASKTWLRNHEATSAEIPVYISHLRDLFHQPTEEDYKTKLDVLKLNWSLPFCEYYLQNIDPQVTTSIGRWILEPLGVYSPYSGVTTNQSESFNAVLKALQHWKEVPLDAIVLSFYYLQIYYHNEIQRGFCGIGTYKLLSEFSCLQCSTDELRILKAMPPDEIVQSIKSKALPNSATDTECDLTVNPDEDSSAEVDSSMLTQYSRARMLIDRGEISHNVKLGVFTVLGTTGTPHAVKLFPTQSCSCPSSGCCYHIIAAQMSIGLESGSTQRKINLTQLRRNSRKKSDKTSGRKKPRPADYDVVAAPDSNASSYMIDSCASDEKSVKNGKRKSPQTPSDETSKARKLNSKDKKSSVADSPQVVVLASPDKHGEESIQSNESGSSTGFSDCGDEEFKSSLLTDKLYHMEMLRLWEECNPNHKIDYCMDEVDQELGSERKPGQLLMYVTLDVYTWLEVRKNRGRVELNRVGNYVLASSKDRQEFDKFRDSEFFKERPLIKTAVLEKFMEEQCKCKINLCNKFGIDKLSNFKV